MEKGEKIKSKRNVEKIIKNIKGVTLIIILSIGVISVIFSKGSSPELEKKLDKKTHLYFLEKNQNNPIPKSPVPESRSRYFLPEQLRTIGDYFKSGHVISLPEQPRNIDKVVYHPAAWDTLSDQIVHPFYRIRIYTTINDTLRVKIYSYTENDTLEKILRIPIPLISQPILPTVLLGEGYAVNVYNITSSISRFEDIYGKVCVVSQNDTIHKFIKLIREGRYMPGMGYITSFYTFPLQIRPGDNFKITFIRCINETPYDILITKKSFPDTGFVVVPFDSLYIRNSNNDTCIIRLGDALVVGDSIYSSIALPLSFPLASIDCRIKELNKDGAVIRVVIENTLSSNFGEWFASGKVNILLTNSSGDTVRKDSFNINNLPPGKDTTVYLIYRLPPERYTLFARVNAKNDTVYSNDTASLYFEITTNPGWSQLPQLPLGSGKKCKFSDACVDGYGRIWVIKGGTLENYIWDGEKWSTATQLPAGTKGKTVKGASICYAKGKIYYKESKGPGFYMKDTTANAAWVKLEDYTLNGKYCKAGTSLAWDGGDTIFMTVGGRNSKIDKNKTAVMAKYSISNNNWENELLPPDLVPKNKFNEGASIAATPYGIFVSVGITSDLLKRSKDGSWSKVSDIPIVKKFSGDITYDPIGNCIYINEGKNVSDFYQYQIDWNNWRRLESWPLVISRKNPKGCALTCTQYGYIFGVKGNNTLEFWRYIPRDIGFSGCSSNREEIMISEKDKDIHLITSGSSKIKGVLYNVLGRKVCEINRKITHLNSLRISPGIYFFRSVDEKTIKMRKKIIKYK